MDNFDCNGYDETIAHNWSSSSIHGAYFVLGWVCLFYIALAVAPFIISRFPSSESKENSDVWVAWNLFAFIQGFAVSVISFYVLFGKKGLWWFEGSDRFAYGAVIRNTGLLFVTFEITDIALGMRHRWLSSMMVIHHLTFIITGIVFLSTPNISCWSGIHIAILLVQEISNPFLSLSVFFNNRLDKGLGLFLLWIFRLLFGILFVIFRIVLNTWCAIDFIGGWKRGQVPDGVPALLVWSLIGGMLLGACMQWLWALQLLSMSLSDVELKKEINKIVDEMMSPMFTKIISKEFPMVASHVANIRKPDTKKQI